MCSIQDKLSQLKPSLYSKTFIAQVRNMALVSRALKSKINFIISNFYQDKNSDD